MPSGTGKTISLLSLIVAYILVIKNSNIYDILLLVTLVKSSQFYLTYTEYYVCKVRMILQFCFTKVEEEEKISLIKCCYCVEFWTPK